MSASAEGAGATTKATTSEPPTGPTMKDQQKPAAALEEDDEFEDFPVDSMSPGNYAINEMELILGFRRLARVGERGSAQFGECQCYDAFVGRELG